MSENIEEQHGTMNAGWLGFAWVLPQLLLAFLNWHAWVLVRGDMSLTQYSRALTIGIFEASLLAAGCLAWLIQARLKKPIGLVLALAAVAAHIGYLWWFLQSLDHLLPSSVSLWMLPETELLFYQFSLMMPAVFLMLVRLARTRLGLSAPVDVGLSLAALVLIPAGAFILGSLLSHIRYAWHDGIQTLLITAMVTATACILVAFLRLMIRLHDLIERRSWSDWAIPLAAGLLAPLAGLALNASIPFPYDFQSPAIYLMTLLNAAALLIPFRPGTPWALPGWAARAALYPFTIYFFLVFLPFLPLSLLAMIVAGAGFLILAPLLLFVVHTRRLWTQGSQLATRHGTARTAAWFAACVLILPALFLLRNEHDRRTLNRATDAVFSPDFTASRLEIGTTSLSRALDRMEDMKDGIYLPYLSDLYDTMVFRGMVLPEEKANLIRQSLLGKARTEEKHSDRWGVAELFGGRSRGRHRTRGLGVTRNVDLTDQDATFSQTNGVSETEVRLTLKNAGTGNGEFSERIAVPEGVLVTGFWLDVNGTNKPAQLRERKAATWVYEMIRDMTRRDPGLLVYENDQNLRLRVFPFAANETRRCGITFRFPSVLQPSVSIGNTPIALANPQEISPSPSTAVVGLLPDASNALVIPSAVITNWPSFRRDVVAHLILDQSAMAETNRAGTIARARSQLAALPASITRVRLTWANFEQEDLPGESLTREEADRALERIPTLPFRGGFCPERVIARVLLAESTAPRSPAPAGAASLFIAIPSSNSTPVHSINLAPFARLSPDLPGYLVATYQGLQRVAFSTATRELLRSSDFTPSPLVAIRNGTTTTLTAADKGAVVFAPRPPPTGWQVWTPSTGRYETLTNLSSCSDATYLAGLSLWQQHNSLAWTPGKLDGALPELIKAARSSNVLIPEAAFIVLETKSQEVMLARKERQGLSANHALEFDDAKTEKAPSPAAAWLILPAIWLLWRGRSKTTRIC